LDAGRTRKSLCPQLLSLLVQKYKILMQKTDALHVKRYKY